MHTNKQTLQLADLTTCQLISDVNPCPLREGLVLVLVGPVREGSVLVLVGPVLVQVTLVVVVEKCT